MANKNKGAKGKHAAQKPSKEKFNSKKGGKGSASSQFGASGSAAKTSTWSGKSWGTNSAGTVQYGGTAAAYDASAVEAYRQKRNQKKRTKKIAGVVVGIIVAVLAVVYIAGAVFFSSHFLPNTTIGDDDISLMTADAVASDLEAESKSYTMQVTGERLDLTINATDSGVNIDATSVAGNAMNSFSAWEWPVLIFQSHDYSNLLQYAYDGSTLGKTIKQAVNKVNKTATAPTNATIAYDSDEGKFVVQKEKAGTKLDYNKVMDKVTESVLSMTEKVTITEDELQQPSVTSTDSRLATAADNANAYLKANFKLTIDGTKVATVDADQISEWVTLDKNLNPSFNNDALKTWVANLASEVGTVGAKRTLTTSNGGTYTVSGGDYGWSINQDSLVTKIENAVKDGKTGTVKIPCSSEGKAYSTSGNDIGKRYVDVNLSTQHAVMYVNGKKVWEADVVTGKPDGEHNTPTGVYYIKNKESPSTLIGQMISGTNTPSYRTKVQYWMPFVENYIGFHDATWQSAFGGTRYKDGYGSHGCVNLSLSKAGALYDVIQIGDPVIVHK